MAKIRFLLVLFFTVALVLAMNMRLGDIPPLGKFLDPFSGFWQNSEGAAMEIDAEVNLAGLEKPGTIVYDERGVPHIFAETEHDVYFLQGYATAQARLFQMQLQAFAASGRLSEMFGERALEFDRLSRRRGMLWAAERTVEFIKEDEHSMMILNAYADGVNAYIDQLSYADLPVEFKLLDLKPEAWEPIKTAALLKYMSNMLTGKTWDFEYTNSLRILGSEQFKRLFPLREDMVDAIIPSGYDSMRCSLTLDTPEVFQPVDSIPPLIRPDINPDNGSNNWAVHGSKTKSGNPILCNDPHLALNLPSIWFEMQLHGPDLNVYGVGLAGAPGIIVGFNENVAWGVTNASRDVQDWYRIEFTDESKARYKYADSSRAIVTRVETVYVRGAEAFLDTVKYTHHGPVVYDENFSDESKPQNIAMHWTAHMESNEMMTFYGLNHAKNHSDYREALKHFRAPGQNIVFASKEGDVAITQQGNFPAKWPYQGWFVMDGSDPTHEWQGWIPFDQNPHVKNPDRGFVSSANQIPVGDGYEYDISGWYENFRNRRINKLLNEMEGVTVEDMMRMQNDNYNTAASIALPILLERLDESQVSAEGKPYLEALKNWDYMNEPEIIAPSIFELWSGKVYKEIWNSVLGDAEWPSQFHTMNLIKTDSSFQLPAKVVTYSFGFAVDSLGKMAKQSEDGVHWTDYKSTYIQHLMRIPAFSRDDIRNGGNRNIINATSERHGPSWRMIVELGDKPRGYGIIPGGQSGNPGSARYDDQIEKWVKGEYYELQFLNSADGLKEGWQSQKVNPAK